MTDVIGKVLGAIDPEDDIIDNEEHPIYESIEGDDVDVREDTNHEIVNSQTAELQAVNEEAVRFNEIQEFVNSNIRDIIVQGMENLKDVLDVMSSSEEPKMYQAGAAFIKTLVDTNKTLFEVNKPQNAGASTGPNSANPATAVQINNNVTYKTTAEMLAEDDEE